MTRIKRGGLTLMEVLVVLGILFVLFLLFVPALRRVREPANRMTCSNNLKMLNLAIINYEQHAGGARPVVKGLDPNKRSYPPGCVGPGDLPEDRLSWMVAILPFLEQESLYKKIDWKQGYAGNLQVTQEKIRMFQCPSFPRKEKDESDQEKVMTHYVGMAGVGLDAPNRPAGVPGNGFMGYERITTSAMIKDGTANTIAFIETRNQPGHWAQGGFTTVRGLDLVSFSGTVDPPPFGGLHQGQISVGFLDGSVRFLSSKIHPEKLAALVTIDGNEPVIFE